MKYCSQCGSSVIQTVPPGDNRPRYVCNDCGTIHYSNPNNVCG
nr:zinc ribbon domain-containing protein [Gammaproteobacteria bacterium]